jgi:hypothetical protein
MARLTDFHCQQLCEGFFFLAGCVLGVFLFQGLEKSLMLSGTFVARLL